MKSNNKRKTTDKKQIKIRISFHSKFKTQMVFILCSNIWSNKCKSLQKFRQMGRCFLKFQHLNFFQDKQNLCFISLALCRKLVSAL